MSPIRVDDDLLPTTVFAVPLTQLGQPAGWLVGEFSLEEMWRMVDDIRIGAHGFALVVAPDGTLVAHGDPDKKALVAQARNMKGHPLVDVGSASLPASREFVDENGQPQLAVAAQIRDLGWTVIVEQPTRRSLRHRNGPAEAAPDRHRVGPVAHDRCRAPVRPPVHRTDFHAEGRRRKRLPRATSNPA